MVRDEHPRNHDTELVRFLHPDPAIGEAQQRLRELITAVIAEAVTAGQVRTDVGPGELANYCLHALAGAANLDGDQAIARLVDLTVSGIRTRTR